MAKNRHHGATLDDLLGDTPKIETTPLNQPERPEKLPKRSELSEEVHDWQDIESAPTDGKQVYLSANGEGEGYLCYARLTRRAVGFRWEPVRIWTVVSTRVAVNFTPKFWRAT